MYIVHDLSSVTMQLHSRVCYSDISIRYIGGSCKGCIKSVSKLQIKNIIKHTRIINCSYIILLNLHVSDVEVKKIKIGL